MSEESRKSVETAEILDTVQPDEDQDLAIQREEHAVQLVVIVLAEKYYAFYGESIKEIMPLSEITHVPGMPAYILGVMNVRGEIESVLDLKKLLGLPDTPITGQSRLIIGEINEIRSGLLVDSVEDVLELPENQISKSVSQANEKWADSLVGEVCYKGDAVALLDLGKIFEALLCD